MEISKRVSTITIVVLVLILCVIIFFVCYALGFFKFIDKGESVSYDGPTQVTEEYQVKEFTMDIEGQNNITILATGEKVNCSKEIYSKYILDEFEVENFDISCLEGITKISCTVTNTGSERKNLKGIYIYLYDEENVCKTCKLVEGMKISSKETKEMDIIIDADVANVYRLALKEAY